MLSSLPARQDLTDRECSKIIGGLLGSLCSMASVETVRDAVKWWAEREDVWTAFRKAKDAERNVFAARD